MLLVVSFIRFNNSFSVSAPSASPFKEDTEKTKKGKSSKCQSARQPIDAFLVRIKHDLYKRGFRALDQYWEDTLNDATELWNTIHGTSFPRSKDSPMWFRKK